MQWTTEINAVGQFLVRRRVGIAVVAILLVHALLLARIAVVNAPVYDEIGHLPSGLSHWRFGNFSLYRVNPPLMRMIAAIPLLWSSPQEDWSGYSDAPYERPEFVVGRQFMKTNGINVFWHFIIARWTQVVVSVFGGWICYCWARDLFGRGSGLLALTLWCFDPNILGWGAILTPDVGAAAFGVAAGYTFWRWLKSPTWRRAALAGLALGIVELTKSTWILLFGLWPLMWLGWKLLNRNNESPRPVALQLATILGLGLYLLNLGYGFEGSFRRLGEFEFISETLGGPKAHDVPGNRFRETWVANIPVPVPANYLSGMDVQKYDFEVGKWSYLRGEFRRGGWWYYYLYALLVKEPLGTLALFGGAVLLLTVGKTYRADFQNEFVLLLPAVVVLALVSSQTGFNRYLRYVLPSLPFLFIFASRVAKSLQLRDWGIVACTTTAISASLVGSLSVFPYSMSYFNLIAGGPKGGHRHLLDANLDWGQDLLELKRFLDKHPEARPIHLSYFGYAQPSTVGIDYEGVPRLSEAEKGEMFPRLAPGWYAISANHVFGYRHNDSDTPGYTYFQRLTPVAMAGYSIYIYHIQY